MKKTSPALLLHSILLVYVLLQFSWWGYLIYNLNSEILHLSHDSDQQILEQEMKAKLWMVIGEGTVFITLLLTGAFFIGKYIIREQQMAHQERNFLLATTHELNSPLAAAKLNLQTLNRSELNEDQKTRMIESGLSNVNRLEKLVFNILTASRIDGGKFQLTNERIEVQPLIEKLIRRHEALLSEASIQSFLDIQNGLSINGDERAIELVYENLIFNAIKYAKASELHFEGCIKNNKVVLVVYDFGPGVEEAQLKSLFRKFYRVENEETRAQKGTGLGLYLVKEIIKLHNGTIRAINLKPHGLKFLIELPK